MLEPHLSSARATVGLCAVLRVCSLCCVLHCRPLLHRHLLRVALISVACCTVVRCVLHRRLLRVALLSVACCTAVRCVLSMARPALQSATLRGSPRNAAARRAERHPHVRKMPAAIPRLQGRRGCIWWRGIGQALTECCTLRDCTRSTPSVAVPTLPEMEGLLKPYGGCK
jgi:hypothetical protein